MAKQTKNSPLSSLNDLENTISKQTTENKQEKISPDENNSSNENKDTFPKKDNTKKSSEIDDNPKNKLVGGKEFVDFFNKDYSTKDSEPMMINKDIKKILEKISGSSSGTTQSSLTSNILMDWIQTHKKDIEKILREQNKISF